MAVQNELVSARLRDAESRVGVTVGKQRLDLDLLKREGVLIEVSVKGLSVCSRRTTNGERGITDDDVRRKRLTSGVTKTIPSEELSSLEAIQAQIHSNLSEFGYTGIGFNPARFITWRAWTEWYERQCDYEARWADVVGRLCDKLPEFSLECQSAFQLIATKSWQAIWRNHEGEEVVTVDGVSYRKAHGEYAALEARIVDNALAKIPTPDIVRSSMLVSWTPRIIMTSADYEAEIARYEHERTVGMQERVAQSQALNEQRQLEHEAGAVREIVAEKLRRQLLSMPDPRDDMVLQLRQRLAGVAESTRESIESKGRLYRPTSEALGKMSQTFNRMDVGDDDLRALIAELQSRLDTKLDDGKYNVDAIGDTLRKIEALHNSSIARNASANRISSRIEALEI